MIGLCLLTASSPYSRFPRLKTKDYLVKTKVSIYLYRQPPSGQSRDLSGHALAYRWRVRRHKVSSSAQGRSRNGRCLFRKSYGPFLCRPPLLPHPVPRYAVSHIHVHYIPIVGVGKERRIQNWSVVKPEKAALVTGTTLGTNGPVPADRRQ